jgi:hypothetical protein
MAAVMDATSIWLHTRTAVTDARYPARLSYTISVTGQDGSAPSSNHYRASTDPDDGTIRISTISNEQLASPAPIPHGVNVKAEVAICMPVCTGYSLAIGHPQSYQDLIGEPFLTPTYMFGMRELIAHAQQTALALPVITTVSVGTADYRVALLDTPTLDGTETYHLQMTPVRSPKTHRLRELWVGTGDYLPRKALVSGNFTIAPLVDVPWIIDFSILNGAPYIQDERATSTLYLAHRRVVSNAVIGFEKIQEPDGFLDEPLISPDAPDDALVEP